MGIFEKVRTFLGSGRGDAADSTAPIPVRDAVETIDPDDFYGANRPETGYRPVMADWIDHRPAVVAMTSGDESRIGHHFREFLDIEQTRTPTLDQIAEIVVDIAATWPDHVMDGLRHGPTPVSEGTIGLMERNLARTASFGVTAYDRSHWLMEQAVLDISLTSPLAADAWEANSFRAVQAAAIVGGSPDASDIPEQLSNDMARAIDVRWSIVTDRGTDRVDVNAFGRALDEADWSEHLKADNDGYVPSAEDRAAYFGGPYRDANPGLSEIAEMVSESMWTQPPIMEDLRYGRYAVDRDVADRIEERAGTPEMAKENGNGRYQWAMAEVVANLRVRLPEFDRTLRTRADETMSHHLPELRASGQEMRDAAGIQDAIISKAASVSMRFAIDEGGIPIGMDGFDDPQAIARALTVPVTGASSEIGRQSGEPRKEDVLDGGLGEPAKGDPRTVGMEMMRAAMKGDQRGR